MATYYFLGTENTDWDEGGNWYDTPSGGNNNTIPSSSDDVVILAEVNAVGVPPTVNSVLIDNGGLTTIDFTATNGCTVTNGGRLARGTIVANVLCNSGGGVIGWSSNDEGSPNIVGNLILGSNGFTDANDDYPISVSDDLIFQNDFEQGSASWINVSNNVYYYYGATGSFSNLNVAGNILYVDYPELYFVAGPSYDWADLDNWWVDSSYTQKASALPSNTQDVYIGSDITSDSSSAATANNMTVYSPLAGSRYINISVTVVATSTFQQDTYYGSGSSVTLTSPSVVMNDNSYLNTNSSVVGDVNFYGTSSHVGSITGNVTVYSPHAVPFNSSNGNNGTISGTITYSGYSSRTVYFYHTSSSESWTDINYWYNGSGGTGGNANYVPDGAISLDDVIIEATPFDSTSTNRVVQTLTVNQNPTTFNSPYIYNNMVITCNYANFNDYSVNQGTITQSQYHSGNRISFNDFSSNGSTGVVEPFTVNFVPARFQDNSFNDGTINGDVEVYYPSEKPIGGTVNGTVTYYGYTLYFAYGGLVEGDWADPGNWFIDLNLGNPYNNIPSEIIPYQDVVITSNVLIYTGAGIPSANNLSTYGSYPYVQNINITVSNLATFSEETYLDASATITGDVLFENLATNRGGTITGTATFTLSSAETMINNGYDGTYGNIEFQYGKGVNGSNILGIV